MCNLLQQVFGTRLRIHSQIGWGATYAQLAFNKASLPKYATLCYTFRIIRLVDVAPAGCWRAARTAVHVDKTGTQA